MDRLRRVEMKVCGLLRRASRWRHVGRLRVRRMRKLDEIQVRWIVREKAKGEMTNAEIARTMNVSTIWVKKLWARYRHAREDLGQITYPRPMGRPKKQSPGRREHAAVLAHRTKYRHGAVKLEECIEESTGLHIPHNTIHKILREENLAAKQPKKSKRRKWIRYERTYSNSMWHTDYKQLDDGRWFVSYQDDASRCITGFGVFDEATTEHAVQVLHEAMTKYGKPASILSDHGSQFYANESECKRKGESEFEKELDRLEIRHILARVRHPQTNGKLERFHGELQRHLKSFEEESSEKTTRTMGRPSSVGGPFYTAEKQDSVTRLVIWYNEERAHMSLNKNETPLQAFKRKMPPAGAKVIDDQTGEEYHVA